MTALSRERSRAGRLRRAPALLHLLPAALLLLAGCREKPADPSELFITQSKGVNFLERGQLPEAEEQFRKLVRMAPGDPLGHANLGLTYLRGGRFDDAERELRRAQRLDPTNRDVGLIVARLYSLTNRWDEAQGTLETLVREHPRDPKLLYALAEVERRDSTAAPSPEYIKRLRDAIAVAPTNIAIRLKRADAFVRTGQSDSAAAYLVELRRLRPEPPRESLPFLASAIDLLQQDKPAEARAPFDRFRHFLELSKPYQTALADVKWLEGPIVGRPVLTFKPESRIKMLGVIPTGDSAARLRFTDITGDAGVAGPPSAGAGASRVVLAAGDFDGSEGDEMFASVWSPEQSALASQLFRVRAWGSMNVTQQAGFPTRTAATAAAVGDYDNDGWLDLYVAGADGRGQLLRNAGADLQKEATFRDVTARAGVGDARGVTRALFVDFDHDGDVDLLTIGSTGVRAWRNNADGTFADVAASIGLGLAATARDAAFADFDGDARIDFALATDSGPRLYRNSAGAAQRFQDATATSGLPANTPLSLIAAADYDNDGDIDLLLDGRDGASLWRNDGGGRFTADRRLFHVPGGPHSGASFVDVDNDGWLDLVFVGTSGGAAGRGIVLLRGTGSGAFADRSQLLPASARSAGGSSVLPNDIDDDGDLDLLIGGDGGFRVLRNDGGNANMSTQVALVGLRAGSGKNNTFGIGSKLQLRVGDVLQTRVVTDRLTYFGLGPHLKADVLRVEWTNGVPQTIYFPGTDQDVLELEQLKGSCAFVYTWDGKEFRFVTDVMWRSALGMPMGLMAGGGSNGARMAYAPAGASQEYLRIPGSVLAPRDGHYVLQVTEELWETAYVDRVRLIAVDHPDSVDVFVDERFVPPGPVQLRLYTVGRQQPPVSAVDGRGRNVLPALEQQDRVYVGDFTPTAYQGIVEPHEVVLDLGPDAGADGSALFLRGWIYPTDASINIALSQQSKVAPMMPSLEVRDASGRWTNAGSIGFPSGKDKTIIVRLAGKFPTQDHHVRIRTNMRIHWDQAFVAQENAGAAVRTTTLDPTAADLHFRGYSKMYRAGGRDGPHWFDYANVSTDAPWRPIEGAFTRFGDVLPLLGAPDDQYVIMAPGDEMTVRFDASSASALPPGWSRDFLLYTDGWIKDSDLNTAFGTSVRPLPYHAVKQYPYTRGDAYPADSARQRYLREYNTRIVKR